MLAAQEEANDCYNEESYDSEDSLETSLSDELDSCCVFGQDATMDDAYGDEISIVTYDKNEIVVIAPLLDCLIILLNSPNYTNSENFALIKAQCDVMHLSYDP